MVEKSGAAARRTPRQRWTGEHRARWLAAGRDSAAFELPAEDFVPVWMRRVRPSLVVRCTAGRIDAFVFTDSALAIEAHTEDHTVTYAFDDAAARIERWADSEDHDALFAPDGAAFARHVVASRTLQFGYTPHNAAPVTARFSVAGLEALLQSSARPCGLSRAAARR